MDSIQTFTCQACGTDFSRPKMRGTRPKWCPDCRDNAHRVDWSRSCEACGKRGIRRDGKYCSQECQPLRRNIAARRLATAARGRAATTPWYVGPCAECGHHVVFGGRATTRFCSDLCANRIKKRRRRARKRSARHEPYGSYDIFDRDGWRCQLCMKRVRRDVGHLHDLAPCVDHITPLGADGPDAPDNVQTAHRICNSRKRDLGGAQLRLPAC